ncbi:hypothetical protein F9C28_07750 [Shimwellia pseudoproteus]|nr:hypothetical protein [Shimwellia pseudoproteus]
MLLAAIAAGGSLLSPAYAAGPADKPAVSQGKPLAKPEPKPTARPVPTVSVEDELRVSINSASAEELAQMLNGVGLKKAESIVRYREANGPFTDLDALTEVPGIGAALVARNKALIKL